MKPNTNKPKTGRRFRGLEVAQAALLLVLGVVAAMALYFVMMDVIRSTPVPDVQLNPYHSVVHGSYAVVTLKFAKTKSTKYIDILNSTGNLISSCSPASITVNAGEEKSFYCYLASGANWDTYMYVHIVFTDGVVVDIPWVAGG